MPLYTPHHGIWMPVDLANPVNKNHRLADALLSWWLGVPPIDGGVFWYDLIRGAKGTLTSMSSASGWRGTTRPGGWSDLLFDGTNDTVAMGNNPNTAVAGNCALVFWINFAATGATYNLLGDCTSGGTQGQIGSRRLNTNVIQAFWGGSFVMSSTSTVSANTWYMVGITRYGSTGSWTGEIWLNGVLDKQTTAISTNPSTQNVFTVGNIGAVTSNYFSGRIDDVKLYGRQLVAADFLDLYLSSRDQYRGLLNRVPRRFYAAPVVGGGPAPHHVRRRMNGGSEGGMISLG